MLSTGRHQYVYERNPERHVRVERRKRVAAGLGWEIDLPEDTRVLGGVGCSGVYVVVRISRDMVVACSPRDALTELAVYPDMIKKLNVRPLSDTSERSARKLQDWRDLIQSLHKQVEWPSSCEIVPDV